MDQEQVKKQPWQIMRENYNELSKYYKVMIDNFKKSKESAKSSDDIVKYENIISMYEAEIGLLAFIVNEAERKMEKYVEDMKYFNILRSILTELSNLDNNEINNTISKVRKSLGSEIDNYKEYTEKSFEEIMQRLDAPEKKLFRKKTKDELYHARTLKLHDKLPFNEITKWVKGWKNSSNIDVSKVTLTLEDNVEIKHYDTKIKKLENNDSKVLLTKINTYKNLEDRFKSGISNDKLKELENDIEEYDKLLFAVEKIEELIDKTQKYSKSFKVINSKFDTASIIEPLNKVLDNLKKEFEKKKEKIDKHINIVEDGINKKSEYQNAYNNYVSLYRKYAKLDQRDPFSLTEKEKQDKKEMEAELKRLKENYNLDVQGIEDVIRTENQEKKTVDELRKLGVYDEVAPDIVKEFIEKYPEVYEKIKGLVNEQMRHESERGYFGEQNDSIDREYQEKYEKRRNELIEKSIKDYLKTIEKKKQREKEDEIIEEDLKRYGVYKEVAIQRLIWDKKITEKDLYDGTPAVQKTIYDMCKQYAEMSGMTPEERAIYIGTYMTPKGTSLAIESNNGKMKKINELSPQEIIAFKNHLNMVERHPEIYNLDSEFKHLSESKKM